MKQGTKYSITTPHGVVEEEVLSRAKSACSSRKFSHICVDETIDIGKSLLDLKTLCDVVSGLVERTVSTTTSLLLHNMITQAQMTTLEQLCANHGPVVCRAETRREDVTAKMHSANVHNQIDVDGGDGEWSGTTVGHLELECASKAGDSGAKIVIEELPAGIVSPDSIGKVC